MSRAPKLQKAATETADTVSRPFQGRAALGAYLRDPAGYPPNRVIYHTEKFVVINDLYPKSLIHTLVLPRDNSKNLLHPFEAFQDPEFLTEVQQEVRKVVALIGKELRRNLGRYSTQEQAREAAMMDDPPPDILPHGRDWEKEVISGIHAGPSMDHLHVHVFSVDRVGDSMKKKSHYNSFATPFLVPLEAFPLRPDDPTRHAAKQGYLRGDLICWRCGKNFGNRFTRFKDHLLDEREAWKKE